MSQEILNFTTVKRMCDSIAIQSPYSTLTLRTYLLSLVRFTKLCGYPDLDALVEEIRKGKLNPDDVYRSYAVKLTSCSLAPKSVITMLAGLKKFFTENDIELKKRHRIKGFTIHESTLPSYEQLSDLLRISDLRARTAILMLLSSGLRIGELSRLRLGNIELDVTPAGIYLSSKFTKSRRKRVTFISTEAQASLKAYLEKRKSRGHSINDDSPVIATRKGDPVTVWGLYEIVHRPMAQLSKKDPDGWYTLRPHILRKFFITQMLLAGVPDAIVDAMVGHQRYLAKEYELFEVPHFRQWYEKAMPRLLILEQPKLSKESVVLELSTKLAEALGVPYEELSQSLKQATTPAIQERMIGKVWDLIENRFKPITELSYVENRSGKPTRVKEICVKPEHFIEK